MKIAFSTSGDTLDAPLDSRFGRCKTFLILDTSTNETTLLNNSQNLTAVQGAGIQAAQHVVSAGADCIITGHCGPKAFRVLSEANVTIYTCTATTLKEALNLYNTGRIKAADKADVEGHWI